MLLLELKRFDGPVAVTREATHVLSIFNKNPGQDEGKELLLLPAAEDNLSSLSLVIVLTSPPTAPVDDTVRPTSTPAANNLSMSLCLT